jgi:type IV pilus assembly protein PilN
VIRVNLLAQKREVAKAAADADQRWILVALAVVVIEIIGLLFFHQAKREELAKIKRNNGELSAQIDAIKKAIANHPEVKAQLDLFRAREEAIQKLQSARTGPTAVLLELARLLTPGHGPTADADRLQQLRRDNPAAVFNPSWDSRRLWLTGYAEIDRTVKLEGLARDGDDVSELARRLSLSLYFTDVKLLAGSRGTETAASQSSVSLAKFQLQAKARY